jgi:hypothetical protein
VSKTDNCIDVKNAYFHDLSPQDSSGGAIYVELAGVEPTISLTTFSQCQLSAEKPGGCF